MKLNSKFDHWNSNFFAKKTRTIKVEPDMSQNDMKERTSMFKISLDMTEYLMI